MHLKMEIKKVLFFKPGAIGDLLHTLPALRALKKNITAAHITVVVSPGLESLIHGTYLADRIQVFDKSKLKKKLKDFIKFGLRLREEGYDLFVDMQPSIRSLILRRISGAPIVLVYKKQKKHEMGEKRLHAVENFMKVLLPLGITEQIDSIELSIPEDAMLIADRFLDDNRIDKTRPLVGLNCSVGAARPARNWFPERFAMLADRLIKELGVAVIFVGGSEDKALVQNVMKVMQERAASAAGMFSVLQSAALLKRCTCLVSSDTGPLHLATAVQTPVIGLYGSTDPKRTGPVGSEHQVLIKEISCIPCEKKLCPDGNRACMAEITVDEVFEAVRKVIICN